MQIHTAMLEALKVQRRLSSFLGSRKQKNVELGELRAYYCSTVLAYYLAHPVPS
jgi:hypothetical protein